MYYNLNTTIYTEHLFVYSLNTSKKIEVFYRKECKYERAAENIDPVCRLLVKCYTIDFYGNLLYSSQLDIVFQMQIPEL